MSAGLDSTAADAGGRLRPTPAATSHTFPVLDGVRAVAVLMVLGTHAAYWTGRYLRGEGTGILARLDSGVAVFFSLSGFLLIRPWLAAAVYARPGPRVGVYFWHRALRILPMYWLSVAAALVVLPENSATRAGDWWHNLLLVQIYQNGWFVQGLTQTWSLCTEVAFYLVLPLFGVAATAWSRRFGWRPVHLLLGCALVASVSIVWTLVVNDTPQAISLPTAFWLPNQLSWFAAGMALAVVQVDAVRNPHRWTRLRGAAQSPLACWSTAAALLVFAATPVAGPLAVGGAQTGAALTKNLTYAIFAALVLLPGALAETRLATAALGNPVMRWLGRISYSMFLTHLIVLDLGMRMLGYPVFTGSAAQVFLVTLAGTVAVSAVTYRWVEVPVLRLRNRFGPPTIARRPAPRPRSSPAPPA